MNTLVHGWIEKKIGSAPAHDYSRPLRGWFAGAKRMIMRANSRKRDVAHLRDLPDYLLRDIGIDRESIEHATHAGRSMHERSASGARGTRHS